MPERKLRRIFKSLISLIATIHSDIPFLFGEYEHLQKYKIALKEYIFAFDVRDCIDSLNGFHDEVQQ